VVLLAEVLLAAGDGRGALARTTEALHLSERVGARSVTATGHDLLARLAIGRGAWAEADELAHKALAQRVQIGALPWMPQSLDRMAQVAAGLESYIEAARLLGAADRARTDLGVVRWLPDGPLYDELEQTLTAKIGDDAFGAALAEGGSMALEEAIGWTRRARGTRKRPSSGWESLTATELQIVELAAKGLTNPQIAQRMFISAGTVKVHLAHIFQKLDIRSRSELAAQAARRAP
jgi:DNA-binding CsgD family transcriptional regulator